MKKLTILKALVLSLMVTVCSVMPLHAQTDGFFKSDSGYEDRQTGITSETPDGNGINNQQFGEPTAPLGSGLLIMVAAGAGYAIARRKRSRGDASHASKGTMIILAIALLLGLTQCKKNLETITSNQGTFITLEIANDSKCQINTTAASYEEGLGEVIWEAGDWIMVLDASTFGQVGVLAYNGTVFQGYVGGEGYADPTTGAPLLFVFTGNFQPEEGNIVDIWNQKGQFAVLSFGQSNQPYTGSGAYTSTLNNQCALVKFTLEGGVSATADVKLAGVKTRIQLGQTLTTTAASSRPLVLNNPNNSTTERWAILPCGAGYTADVVIGNHLFPGAATIPALSNNDLAYVTINITGNYKTLPTKAFYGPNGWIEVAKSNLEYMRYSENNRFFCFMDNDWSTITDDEYGLTHFRMGAWGYKAYADDNVKDYDGTWSEFAGPLYDEPLINDWRTMTLAEADVMIGYETNVSKGYNRNKLYYSATVNGVIGMIILSDSWTGWPSGVTEPTGVGMCEWTNVILDASQWATVENAGAIFLPCDGFYASGNDPGWQCFYGLNGTINDNYAGLYIDHNNTGTFGISNSQTRLVRLVRPINVNGLPSPTSGN